jgi:hypothetical protein
MATHVVLKPLKGQLKNISFADAQKMLAEDRAYQPTPKLSPGVYFEKVPAAPKAAAPPQDPDPEPAPEPVREQTYETRTMEAAKPSAPRTTSRRRSSAKS